ncbi:AAA family ATPase [Microbacterium sp. NPDC089189]|uniref:AAA family ATPase n=1 Tax=Microbacterium sp. NPDC089189 TaxID=3154972 RepID=UPI00344A6F5C
MTTSEEAVVPVAYITLGGAGSGKSTLSAYLSRLAGAVYLDKDTLAGPLVRVALEALGQDPSDRESNALYFEKVMPAEYETLFDTAGRNLELGLSVVLDAPFVAYLDDEDFLRRATENAKWPMTRIRVIHVETSRDVVRRRLIERGSARDRVKLADWDAYWARYGTLRCRWSTGEHVSVSNDDDSALERLAALI